MSNKPSYIDPFDSNHWFEMDEIQCPCQGDGHANINDEWEECALHYHGQLHPQSRALLLDDPVQLVEAERVSILNWKIGRTRGELAELQEKMRLKSKEVFLLELELVNKTPTLQIEAVKIPDNCYPTVQMKAVRVQVGK